MCSLRLDELIFPDNLSQQNQIYMDDKGNEFDLS